nr:hypothetical protein [Tanacetum cinerariifolium]
MTLTLSLVVGDAVSTHFVAIAAISSPKSCCRRHCSLARSRYLTPLSRWKSCCRCCIHDENLIAADAGALGRQETTLRGVDAQTRFETASKESRDPPLLEVNTCRSGEVTKRGYLLARCCGVIIGHHKCRSSHALLQDS